jgi:hypothetical protein
MSRQAAEVGPPESEMLKQGHHVHSSQVAGEHFYMEAVKLARQAMFDWLDETLG